MSQDPSPPATGEADRSPTGGGEAGRYEVGEQDASGGHRVVRDRVLDRRSQARVVPPEGAEALEREARLLARIDHAGVPAVLDFQRSATGAMLVLRRTDGITLAQAVARAQAGSPPPELAGPSAVAQVMRRVCEALAAAHACGVVHGHLAPEAVLLGGQGQVLVLGWERASEGAASAAGPDGRHQDIRGVGACLFTALVLRPPAPEGRDPLGPLRDDESRRAPAALLAIARRALRSDAAGGYPDMAALEADLGEAIAGQAPRAEEAGGLRGRLRRHAVGLAIAVALLAAAAAALAPGLRERWAWGEPVVAEDFADNTWTSRWMEPSFQGSMFRVQDGRLVSTAVRGADLIYRQILTVPVAIEYTGEILPGSQPCDLSVTWHDNIGEPGDGVIPAGGRTFSMQYGGYSNLGILLNRSGDRLPAAYSPEKLEVGRRYRFRVEIDDDRIVMLMDGRRILEYQDLAGFTSGVLALYGHWPGKAFDDVRIYQQPPRRELPPTAPGDLFLRSRKFEEAARLYGLTAQEHAGRPEGQLALFKRGVALWELGRRGDAQASWSKVADPRLADRIETYTLVAERDPARLEEFSRRFSERFRSESSRRDLLLQLWRDLVRRLAAEPQSDARLADRLLELRQRFFAEDGMAAYYGSSLLLAQSRWEDCLRMFPEDRAVVTTCLLAQGRSGEYIAKDWAASDALIKAWQMQGDFEKLVSQGKTILAIPVFVSLAQCKLGRAEEALADPRQRYPALLHLGRAAELLGDRELLPHQQNEVLIGCGRLAEAAGAGAPELPKSGNDAIAQLLLGDLDAVERAGKASTSAYRFMQAVEAKDAKEATRLRPLVRLPLDLRGHSGWFTALIVLPLADRWAGQADACTQQLKPRLDLLAGIYGKRAWYLARALLGEIPPAELTGMPAVSEAGAWTLLATGMCAELAGDAAAARAAYRAFAALPVHKRLLALNTPDPEVEWFVRWRLRSLGE